MTMQECFFLQKIQEKCVNISMLVGPFKQTNRGRRGQQATCSLPLKPVDEYNSQRKSKENGTTWYNLAPKQ